MGMKQCRCDRCTALGAKDPVEILIAGVPGVLKTSTSLFLGAALGLQATSTDNLFCIQRLYNSSLFDEAKRLEGGGKALCKGIQRQAELVADAVRAISAECVERGQHQILEGVHLLPALYPARSNRYAFLLIERDAENLLARMRAKFALCPTSQALWQEERVRQLLHVQTWLRRQAKEMGWTILETEAPQKNANIIATTLTLALIR